MMVKLKQMLDDFKPGGLAGFRIRGLGLSVWFEESGLWGFGLGARGFGFGVWGFGLGV